MAYSIHEVAAQTVNVLDCNRLQYSNFYIAVPSSEDGVVACNVLAETCTKLKFSQGLSSGYFEAKTGQIIYVTGPNVVQSCLFAAKSEASLLANLTPTFLTGIVGISGTLIGAWFHSTLLRRRERDKAIVRWRVEMIEHAEQIEISGVQVAKLSLPRDVDLATFNEINLIKEKIENQLGPIALDSSTWIRASYAARMINLLKSRTFSSNEPNEE